jgi:nitrous oxidase accessory protein NosD
MRSALAVLAIIAGAYDPGSVPDEPPAQPTPSGRVLHVGRRGVQAAIDRARPGDTVRIARGAYTGPVEVRGASRRGVRLVGDGATIRGSVLVRDSAAVTLRGIGVRGSVTVDAVDRYVLDRVHVSAGVAVRRSAGGTITRVLARGSRGAGIALGPDRERPRLMRTFVREVTVQGNAVGIALDGALAVTISRARILDNGVGVRVDGGRSVVLQDNQLAGNRTDVQTVAPAEG